MSHGGSARPTKKQKTGMADAGGSGSSSGSAAPGTPKGKSPVTGNSDSGVGTSSASTRRRGRGRGGISDSSSGGGPDGGTGDDGRDEERIRGRVTRNQQRQPRCIRCKMDECGCVFEGCASSEESGHEGSGSEDVDDEGGDDDDDNQGVPGPPTHLPHTAKVANRDSVAHHDVVGKNVVLFSLDIETTDSGVNGYPFQISGTAIDMMFTDDPATPRMHGKELDSFDRYATVPKDAVWNVQAAEASHGFLSGKDVRLKDAPPLVEVLKELVVWLENLMGTKTGCLVAWNGKACELSHFHRCFDDVYKDVDGVHWPANLKYFWDPRLTVKNKTGCSLNLKHSSEHVDAELHEGYSCGGGLVQSYVYVREQTHSAPTGTQLPRRCKSTS